MIFQTNGTNVLVETSPWIRDYAALYAKSHQISLQIFPDDHEFLKQFDSFSRDTQFLFGYRFGPETKFGGFKLARIVKRLLGSKVYLFTTLEDPFFPGDPATQYFDGVIPKERILQEMFNPDGLSEAEAKLASELWSLCLNYVFVRKPRKMENFLRGL